MTTEYRVRLDRDACDGVFACLVRDDRFVEAADGLATFRDTAESSAGNGSSTAQVYDDDRIADARQAARACPVGAIEVTPMDERGDVDE